MRIHLGKEPRYCRDARVKLPGPSSRPHISALRTWSLALSSRFPKVLQLLCTSVAARHSPASNKVKCHFVFSPLIAAWSLTSVPTCHHRPPQTHPNTLAHTHTQRCDLCCWIKQSGRRKPERNILWVHSWRVSVSISISVSFISRFFILMWGDSESVCDRVTESVWWSVNIDWRVLTSEARMTNT